MTIPDYSASIVKLDTCIALINYHLALKEYLLAREVLEQVKEAVSDLQDFCTVHATKDRRVLLRGLDIAV